MAMTWKHEENKTDSSGYPRSTCCFTNEFTLNIQNLAGCNFWKASEENTTGSLCALVKTCHFVINGDSYLFSLENHEDIGSEMNQILASSGSFSKMKVELCLPNCFGNQICKMISKIKNDRITTIVFCFDEFTNITDFIGIPRNIFSGFENIREIIFEIYNKSQLSFVKVIAICVAKIKNIRISIYFDTSIGGKLYNTLKYILKKKIMLSLYEKSYHSQNHLLQVLSLLDYRFLPFITGLSIHISSKVLLKKYSNLLNIKDWEEVLCSQNSNGLGKDFLFITKLRNLETLSLYNVSSFHKEIILHR
ncbi:Hypothetical protein SRAE_1000229500 [Strongyloides ratti]|uniref:Uncharacterized protein n=1 Tax=Strongyloides ratti TaxID=34506 RepID=A0A090MWP4_STRRB|nr:Hypothetical protein SRAE_1000229500 [Strongyloides ratti]CEF64039.1 Hypothetical protein SRAE_1000229500 [Strongyloides ratti]